jgi:hypothetical protein
MCLKSTRWWRLDRRSVTHTVHLYEIQSVVFVSPRASLSIVQLSYATLYLLNATVRKYDFATP